MVAPSLLTPEAQKAVATEIARRGLGRTDFELPPDWFHEGQIALWLANFDVILALWGTQAGKTVAGPHWCLREAARTGPGEGAVVGPNYSLLFKKVVPEFRKVWAGYGRYVGSPIPQFIVSPEGMTRLFGSLEERKKRWPNKPGEPEREYESLIVYFGYAENSDSLESMTLNWVWSDEAGQSAYKATSYEALERRLLVRGGRHLLTTTPYVFGWLKSQLYDKWLRGEVPHVGVLNIPSTANPAMDAKRVARAKKNMPPWRFAMMYEGKFTRPAGAIYDCFSQKGEFDDDGNMVRTPDCVPRFLIPRSWIRYQGIDFGNVNTASNWAAMDPQSSVVYVYRTYHDGSKAASEHVTDWDALEESLFERPTGVFDKIKPLNIPIAFGGSPSENDWRAEFAQCGCPISRPPFSDVETGIGRVYALLKTGRLKIFDDLTKLIGEIETYSRKLNDAGEPLAEIEDKASFHRADALRYLCAGVNLDIDDSLPVVVSRGVKDNGDKQKQEGGVFAGERRQDDDDDEDRGNTRTLQRKRVIRRR